MVSRVFCMFKIVGYLLFFFDIEIEDSKSFMSLKNL